MERLSDTSTWASLSVTDLNAELVDAEDIIGFLASSAVNGVVYIDGLGLCPATWPTHVHTLIDAETAGNEGLHALIAHCSGELRPVV
jgi:hypothetical protein